MISNRGNSRIRFESRWRLLFDYSAPLIFRYRLKDKDYYLQIENRNKRLYEREIVRLELPYVREKTKLEGTRTTLNPQYPERAAHQIAFLLKELGHTDQFLFSAAEQIWPSDASEFDSDNGITFFDINSWRDRFPNRTFSVYLLAQEWRAFSASAYIGVKRLKFEDLPPGLKGFISDSNACSTLDSDEPVCFAGAVAFAVKAVDSFGAVTAALHKFQVNRDIHNVVKARFGLALEDFSFAITSFEDKNYSTIRWRDRRSNLRRALMVNIRSRLKAEFLSELFSDFLNSTLAYSDALDSILIGDSASALRALCTGFENLIAPLTTKLSEYGIDREVGQVDLARILAKVIAIDYPRDLFADFVGDINNLLRKSKEEPLKIRFAAQSLARSTNVEKFLFEVLKERSHSLFPYVRALDFCYGRRHDFMAAIFTRFYVDLLHAIAARNSIIHGNKNISDEYTLGLLGHCFKTIISMRIACAAEPLVEKERAAASLESSSSEEFARISDDRFVKYLLLQIYRFNWFNGILDKEKCESFGSDGRKDRHLTQGDMDWHSTDFRNRIDEEYEGMKECIRVAISASPEKYFFGYFENVSLLT
jgi:hypothetical protein